MALPLLLLSAGLSILQGVNKANAANERAELADINSANTILQGGFAAQVEATTSARRNRNLGKAGSDLLRLQTSQMFSSNSEAVSQSDLAVQSQALNDITSEIMAEETFSRSRQQTIRINARIAAAEERQRGENLRSSGKGALLSGILQGAMGAFSGGGGAG